MSINYLHLLKGQDIAIDINVNNINNINNTNIIIMIISSSSDSIDGGNCWTKDGNSISDYWN